MESLEKKILQQLETSQVKIGNHSVTFVDTTEAWKTLSFSHPTNVASRTISRESSVMLESNLQCDAGNATSSVENMNTYDILPEYARYNYSFIPQRDSCCYFCRKASNLSDDGERLSCRICDRLFHEMCVRKRGYCDDEISRNAIMECKDSSVGWSCHRCEDIYNLLTEDEKEEISELFDNVSGEDKVIDIDEFIGQKKEEYRKLVDAEMTVAREQQERELFEAIDIDNSGYIDRWEFLPYMAIRYLSRRKSTEIIGLLSPHEVDTFRYYFREMDTKLQGFVTQFDARQAYVRWYKSKVKPTQDQYVDYTWYGGPKENTILMTMKLNMSVSNKNLKVKNELTITWEQYLKICALHVMSARINTVAKRPKIPPMPIYLYSQSACLCYLDDQM